MHNYLLSYSHRSIRAFQVQMIYLLSFTLASPFKLRPTSKQHLMSVNKKFINFDAENESPERCPLSFGYMRAKSPLRERYYANAPRFASAAAAHCLLMNGNEPRYASLSLWVKMKTRSQSHRGQRDSKHILIRRRH